MSKMIHANALPSAIERKLRTVRRRGVLLAAARGVAVGCAVLLVAMIAAMTIDWVWTLFNPVIRTTLTLSSLTAAVVALAIVAIGPTRRAMRWSHAARAVDAAVPQMQQRWTTVANFAHSSAAPTSTTTKSMLDQVTSEAVVMHSLVRPNQIASAASIRPAVVGLAACVVAMSAFLAVQWEQTSILLQRFLSPTQNITATQLASVTGDRLVPRGEAIEVVTSLSGLSRPSAELTIRFPSGDEEVFEIRADVDEANTFGHVMRVDESLRYRFRAGDGQTQWNSLEVIDFPEIADVRFTLTAPDYVNRPVVEKEVIPRRIKVIEGTQLALSIKPKDPVERLVITLTKPDPNSPDKEIIGHEIELAADSSGWYRYDAELVEDATLRPMLYSHHGLTDEAKAFCRIQVIADQAPVARVTGPKDEMTVAVDDVLEIEFEAHDDHGISTAELIVYDDSKTGEDGEPKVIATRPIPLGEQRLQKHLMGKVQLDLKELGLPSGTNISYAIRVTDNRELSLASAGAKPETPPRTALHDTSPDTSTDVAAITPTEASADTSDETLPFANQASEFSEMAERSLSEDGPESDRQTSEVVSQSAAPADSPRAESADDRLASSIPSAPGVEADRSESVATEETTRPDPSTITSTEPSPSDAPALDRIGDGRDLPPPSNTTLDPQRNQSGQNTETTRKRLKITERLSAIAAAEGRLAEQSQIRDRVVAIDQMLEESETALRALVDHEIPDSQRGEQFKRLDAQLGNIEKYAADLRIETKDNEFAFVGLQMVDVTRTHVTPARDRVFVGIRNPNASDVDAKVAMGHVLRARELLAALLARYDRVKQDRDLNRALEESVTMYEVYVAKRQQLMREAMQNRNPLARKMAVVEVDQEYLDRYAEVLTLRREMMEEFGRLLGDDPRLLSRYLDLIKRRQRSLRDQLSELAERQDDAATELSGWLEIDEEQKDALWTIIMELRLHAATQLAKDAAELAERIEKQMPLEVEADGGTPATVIRRGKQIAERARLIAMDADRAMADTDAASGLSVLLQHSEELVDLFGHLDASLDRLQFEHENEAEFTDYVQPRLLESRTVADLAQAWAMLINDLAQRSYGSIVSVDQQRMAVATQLLRTEMLGIEDDLEGQFQRQAEASVPAEIVALVIQLHQLMESITFNQAAASYAAGRQDLLRAEQQQQLALERFDQAEKLFDRMRRSVAEALDAYEVDNPNIADLRDPTLDEFLAQLEREPSIAAQLGIPDRPRNLRVIADSMLWQQNGSQLLESSGEAAMLRAKQAMQRKGQGERPAKSQSGEEEERTEEERQQMAEAKEAQKLLEESLFAIQEQIDDEATTPQQRRQLDKTAESLRQIIQQSGEDSSDMQTWQTIAQSDQAKAILMALARGERIPDQQWNKLLSTLEDGLWQVRGKRPPEEYRKAIQQYQDQIRELIGSIDDV